MNLHPVGDTIGVMSPSLREQADQGAVVQRVRVQSADGGAKVRWHGIAVQHQLGQHVNVNRAERQGAIQELDPLDAGQLVGADKTQRVGESEAAVGIAARRRLSACRSHH